MSSHLSSSLGIVEEFIAPGRRNRPGTKMTATTLTIHNTDNANRGAGAKAHSRFVRNTGYYVHKGKKNWVSWHFTVDDTFIIQHLPINEVAFHAGSQANGSSIAIEICMNPDSVESKANAKAATLAAHLLAKLGLGVGALRRHKDWTGKNCPSRLLTTSQWTSFVMAVRTELQGAAASVAAAVSDGDTLPDEAEIHLPASVEDYEIDHEAISAVFNEDTDLAFEDQARDYSGTLRRVMDELTSSTSGGGSRLLFPYGVTEISLTVPGGFSLSIKGPSEGQEGDGPTALIDDDTICEAPESDEPDPAAAAEPIQVQLPASTKMFYAYGSPEKRYATARAMRAIEAIANSYFAATGLRLGVGNISRRGGGAMPPHKSHRKGTDVDLRVPRRDTKELPATWQDPAYSRSRTQQLVDIVRSNEVISVRTILFNDGQVSGVQRFNGHDNHLHVSFAALQAAADLSDGAKAPDELAQNVEEPARGFAKVHASAHSSEELNASMDASGSSKVLVSLRPESRREALAASYSSFSAVDESFAACFEDPDPVQTASLAAAAAAQGKVADSKPLDPPPTRVKVFPKLGLALGMVSLDKLSQLRNHRLTKEVHLAPELSRIRPVERQATSQPKTVEWGIKRLGVPQAWKAGFDGTGVIVGHLDTGVDANHPALLGALHSFAEFDLTGYRVESAVPRDSGNHGTHTAGTIAGRRIAERAHIGVAPGCKLASALVIEGGDVIARILGGLEWIVEQNAKVLCMSLGLRGYTAAFEVVVDALWDNDVLPVIAVGNEFANSSRSPGNYTNVLSIGAMSQDDTVADFSSSQRFNRAIDPLVPDLVGPGVDVVSCTPNGGYERMSGSSMATPHIAGLAAILRQASVSANAKDIGEAVLASCRRPASMLEARANRGVPDAMTALAYLGITPATRRSVASRRSRSQMEAIPVGK